MCATATTATPRRRAVSANSTGKRPLPAMSPTRSIVLAADPPLRLRDERQQLLYLRHVTEERAHPRDPVAARPPTMEQHAVGAAQRLDDGGGEAAAAQPDGVQPEEPCAVAGDDAERRNVLRNHRAGGGQ